MLLTQPHPRPLATTHRLTCSTPLLPHQNHPRPPTEPWSAWNPTHRPPSGKGKQILKAIYLVVELAQLCVNCGSVYITRGGGGGVAAVIVEICSMLVIVLVCGNRKPPDTDENSIFLFMTLPVYFTTRTHSHFLLLSSTSLPPVSPKPR